MFQFKGKILNSKSWLNRALVIQYFNPEISLEANSISDDVISLKKAIQAIGHTNEFDLGLGGTSFRFFIFLISRQPGNWIIKAHQRLLDRPQQEASNILEQLGVKTVFSGNGLLIQSQGWLQPAKIVCSAEISSQFVSGLLLSCWDLNFDLEIEIEKPIVSFGYLKMTIELLRSAGMKLKFVENENSVTCKLLKNQKSGVNLLNAELDISSAFALAAAAVIDGDVEITNWNSLSGQPDLIFLDVFRKMNITYKADNHIFQVAKHQSWKCLDFNISKFPDLFPVLAVLCAFSDGVSTLSGGTQLIHKESDRIQKTKELLELIQIKTDLLPDGLRIYGRSSNHNNKIPINFDPDHDHRMAMAAGLIRLKGYNIVVSQPDVVNKSYPSFWEDIGLQI